MPSPTPTSPPPTIRVGIGCLFEVVAVGADAPPRCRLPRPGPQSGHHDPSDGLGWIPPGHAATGKVLVTLRQPGGPLGGLWEFPGGKIEPGETPSEAVRRELLEEIGIDLCGPYRTLATVTHRYDHAIVELIALLGVLRPGVEPRPIEVAATRLVTLEELRALPMPAANESIVAAACDVLSMLRRTA